LRQNAPRPTLLTVGLYFAPGFGAMCLLGVLAAATNARFVKFTVNGEAVTGHEFFATAGAGIGVMGVLALAIAYGIWQERSWTRWLILGFWAALVAMNVGLGWANSGTNGAVSAIISVQCSCCLSAGTSLVKRMSWSTAEPWDGRSLQGPAPRC